MNAVKHKETNLILLGNSEDIGDLPVVREIDNGTPTVTSFWVPDEEELAELNNGGAIALCICGNTHAPVMLTTAPAEDLRRDDNEYN